jgi:hypothetical protein
MITMMYANDYSIINLQASRFSISLSLLFDKVAIPQIATISIIELTFIHNNDIMPTQIQSPHKALLSREAEGTALRCLDNLPASSHH